MARFAGDIFHVRAAVRDVSRSLRVQPNDFAPLSGMAGSSSAMTAIVTSSRFPHELAPIYRGRYERRRKRIVSAKPSSRRRHCKFREPRHGRDRPQDQRRRHQPALQLGPRAAGARHHGRRFRGARRLPPPASLSAGARAPGAGEIRARRAARLRRQQHPLHHLDQDRRMGARQALPLGAAHARQRRPDPVGFRLGRRASQTLCAVAEAGELQGRA